MEVYSQPAMFSLTKLRAVVEAISLSFGLTVFIERAQLAQRLLIGWGRPGALLYTLPSIQVQLI